MQTIGSAGCKFKLILTLHDLDLLLAPTRPGSCPPVRVGWRLFHKTYTRSASCSTTATRS